MILSIAERRLLALAVVAVLGIAGGAAACSFCISEKQTLTEEIDAAEIVVIVRLLKPAEAAGPLQGTKVESGKQTGAGEKESGDSLAGGSAQGEPGEEASDELEMEFPEVVDPETGEALFVIEHIVKGVGKLKVGDQIQSIYFGKVDFDKSFMVRGIAEPLDWAIPLPLSPKAVAYVKQLPSLPAKGADRLAFFQDYLQHEDPVLSQDAFDEFARASNQDLRDLAPRIDLERVMEQIEDPLISPTRRRLFFMLLSVRGGPEHLELLESFIKPDSRDLVPAAEAFTAAGITMGGPLSSALAVDVIHKDERRRKHGLDAMIACYLTLSGGEGLDLIDRRFLSDPDAEQTHVYRTLMALRFLADEEPDLVPRERLLQSARLVLDNMFYADQVVTDLARWKDWSIIERLGRLYRRGLEESSWQYVRIPIITYLDLACEEGGEVAERAKAQLAELEPLDQEHIRIARSMQSFGVLAGAKPAVRGSREEPPADPEASDAMPPDPSAFAATGVAPAAEGGPIDAGDDEAVESAPAESMEETSTVVAAPIPAGAEPLTPPHRSLLLGVPLVAAVGCFGLFWLILRGGPV